MALPRTKLVLATPAALFEAPALRAERIAGELRKSVTDIVYDGYLTVKIYKIAQTEYLGKDKCWLCGLCGR